MSRYYGRKFFLFQQSFLTETAICIVERWKKEWARPFCFCVQSCTGKSYMTTFSFFICRIYRTKVVEIQEFRYHGNVT